MARVAGMWMTRVGRMWVPWVRVRVLRNFVDSAAFIAALACTCTGRPAGTLAPAVVVVVVVLVLVIVVIVVEAWAGGGPRAGRTLADANVLADADFYALVGERAGEAG